MTTKKETGFMDSPASVPASASTSVPEYLVERLAAGDLAPSRAADVRRRLAQEPNGEQRLNGLDLASQRILDEHPPAVIAAEVRRRAGLQLVKGHQAEPWSARRGARWGFAAGVPALAAVALGWALWLKPTVPATDPTEEGATADGERIKGLRPGLRIYRKNAGKVERLKDGAPAHAGDQLQVAYVAAGHRYGVVASVDGVGQVTFHLPSKAGPAARLRPTGEVALPEAYELDAAPGFERFVLVVGDAPFDAASVADVVRGARRSPDGTVVTSFTVRKE